MDVKPLTLMTLKKIANGFPNKDDCISLAIHLGCDPDQVQTWLHSQRQDFANMALEILTTWTNAKVRKPSELQTALVAIKRVDLAERLDSILKEQPVEETSASASSNVTGRDDLKLSSFYNTFSLHFADINTCHSFAVQLQVSSISHDFVKEIQLQKPDIRGHHPMIAFEIMKARHFASIKTNPNVTASELVDRLKSTIADGMPNRPDLIDELTTLRLKAGI